MNNKYTKHPFFSTIKAYILLKQGKTVECNELICEVKPQTQRDPYTIIYLCKIYEIYGTHDESIKLLENVQDVHSKHIKLGELLFSAYVREGRILKQQN